MRKLFLALALFSYATQLPASYVQKAGNDSSIKMGTYVSKTTVVPPPAWSPADEPGQLLWFRADTLVLSGSTITQATDKSGNGWHATPPAAAPTRALNVINGQPTMRFAAASSQYLTFGGTHQFTSKTSSMTLLLVAKANAPLAASGFGVPLGIQTGSGTGIQLYVVLANFTGYGQMNVGGGDAVAASGVGLASFDYSSSFWDLFGVYTAGSAYTSAANWAWYTRGLANNPTNFAGSINSDAAISRSIIGGYLPELAAGLFFDGDIAEAILYDHALSAPTRANWNTYRTTRYGF